jgi:adenylylsulfate kinase
VLTEPSPRDAFAIWVTGLPASGKSTLVAALKSELEALGHHAAVLESDVLREILTPKPRYDDEEREIFYRQMARLGVLLTRQGMPVIFDATANRRSYRDQARRQIPRFLEVYIDTPLEVCAQRDPKGIYRAGREGSADAVPGLQAAYEVPEHPEVLVHGGEEISAAAARRIIAKLTQLGYA